MTDTVAPPMGIAVVQALANLRSTLKEVEEALTAGTPDDRWTAALELRSLRNHATKLIEALLDSLD